MATACSFDDESSAIVLDNGSGMIKAGFAGDDAPRCILRNIIGRPRSRNDTFSGTDQRDCYIGDNAISSKDILTITYPMEHGIITNWDDMEKIWHYLFSKELRISPKEYPILITAPSYNPIGNGEKTTQILFEHFQVPGKNFFHLKYRCSRSILVVLLAMYIGNEARLSVYSLGRCTSLVIEMGDGVIHTMPIYEGRIEEIFIQSIEHQTVRSY